VNFFEEISWDTKLNKLWVFFRNGKFAGFLEMGTLGFCWNHGKFFGFFFRDGNFVILLKSWEILWVFLLEMGTLWFCWNHGKLCRFSRDGNFVILFVSWESLLVFYLGMGTLWFPWNHWKLDEMRSFEYF